MAGPWEKYQASPSPRSGPWDKYRKDAPVIMDRAAFDRQESAEPPPAPLADRVRRQMGLGVRAAGEAATALPGIVYDAAGAVTNVGIMGLNELGADLPYVKRANENVGSLMDAAGLPRPNTDNERLMSAALRSGGTMLLSPGAGVRNVGLAALGGLAGEETYQQTKDPWLASGVDMAVNLGGPAAMSGVRRMARGGEAGRQRVADTAADFAAFDASPTVGQATGRTASAFESVLSKAPGSAGVIQGKGERTLGAFGNKLASLADGETPDSAGRALQSGIKDFVERFKARAGTLYNEVDKHIAPNSPVAVTNSQAALAKLVNPVPYAPEVSDVLRNPRIKQIADAITAAAGNRGAIPYAALKAVRSSVGEMLTGNELVSGAPRAQIKMLYGALTDDMAAAAEAAGPDATKALSRATQFYRSGMGRIEGSLERLSKIEDPERLAAALARGDVTTLMAARRSVTPDEWLTVAKAQAGRLGLARAGQQNADGTASSVETFLTNWNKLDKRAQDVMFAAIPGNPKMADDLRSLARAADAIRKSSKALANPSGSGAAVANISAGTVVLSSLLRGDVQTLSALGFGGLAINRAAALMTSPSFIRVLATSTQWPKERLPALMARLNQIADRELAPSPNGEGNAKAEHQ